MSSWDERMRFLSSFAPDVAAQQQGAMHDICGPLAVQVENIPEELPPREANVRLVSPDERQSSKEEERVQPAAKTCTQQAGERVTSESSAPAVSEDLEGAAVSAAFRFHAVAKMSYMPPSDRRTDSSTNVIGDALAGMLYRDSPGLGLGIGSETVGAGFCNKVVAPVMAADGQSFTNPSDASQHSSLCELVPAIPPGHHLRLRMRMPESTTWGQNFIYIRCGGCVERGAGVRICGAGHYDVEIDGVTGSLTVSSSGRKTIAMSSGWGGQTLVCGVRIQGFPQTGDRQVEITSAKMAPADGQAAGSNVDARQLGGEEPHDVVPSQGAKRRCVERD